MIQTTNYIFENIIDTRHFFTSRLNKDWILDPLSIIQDTFKKKKYYRKWGKLRKSKIIV